MLPKTSPGCRQSRVSSRAGRSRCSARKRSRSRRRCARSAACEKPRIVQLAKAPAASWIWTRSTTATCTCSPGIAPGSRSPARIVSGGPTGSLAADGVDGLYTRTLFRYDSRLIARLSPALELGRSFVRSEYQRNYSALLLLWKGIGQFVVSHPEYRVLFGPVSISSRYSEHSQGLLMAFLLQNHLDRDLAQLIEAINPVEDVHPAPLSSTACPAVDRGSNRLVARAEADGDGVPILLRQYLKLNARLLGFNVDPNFGDALDALMMVDLAAVDPAILNRYFGRQGAARFLDRHRDRRPAYAA